ncbi:MAG: hypothetical protein M1822_001648 [Bathelium mastoideum]|nr:MAG: hypothetical protein M1822_001648 [Bathelium mastoideum]
MAKGERTLNPAAAQRKADKAKALKKSRAQIQVQRTEKLARRNPDRLQRQIDELKDVEQNGGGLRPKDRQTLEQLEKDVRAVRKAREVLGDRAPAFGRRSAGEQGSGSAFGGRAGGVLGKRRRDGERSGSESEETDEDVRQIPMPRDTPPPIPRRPRGHKEASNANETPLGGRREPHPLPEKPQVVPQTTYSAAPQIRDLRKEAVNRFTPAAVQRKASQKKGQGGRLLEPEEIDRLEKEGYADAERAAEAAVEEAEHKMMSTVGIEGSKNLEEEEAEFERQLRNVEMEEVEDEDL